MKTTIFQTDFQVDEENSVIKVEKSFNAKVEKVWDAWIKSEILDQWWGPKPWQAETVSMDFREGGKWIYAMVGPEGERHYSIEIFYKIEPLKRIDSGDYFSDANGNLNNEAPGSKWTISFISDKDESTTVNIQISYDKKEDLEAYLKMGFKEGFEMGLNNLSEWLSR